MSTPAEPRSGRIFAWAVCTLAVGFAILVGICGGQAAIERDRLREENKALLSHNDDLRRQMDGFKIDSRHSHFIKALRINQLEVEVETYRQTYGDLPYDYGYIPDGDDEGMLILPAINLE